MTKFIFSGNVPYLACLILSTFGFYAGYEYAKTVVKPNIPKIAMAERGALITEAVLTRQDISSNVLDEQVTKPINAVVNNYMNKGYLVIDSSKNEDGSYFVMGLPANAIDITSEIRTAIKLPTTKALQIKQ